MPINMIGQKFNRLTVIKFVEYTTTSQWLCLCDCGNTVTVGRGILLEGKQKSCGCWRREKSSQKRIDISGQTFGRLHVIEFSESRKGRAFWLCRCDCGNEKVIEGKAMRQGITVSCGCFSRDKITHRNLSHGLSKTPEYRNWQAMLTRCYNSHSKNWKDYGGRGIKVCARWKKNNFENFLADMGKRPTPQHTLDRFPNNDGNYEPGNVRWATRYEQTHNRGRK